MRVTGSRQNRKIRIAKEKEYEISFRISSSNNAYRLISQEIQGFCGNYKTLLKKVKDKTKDKNGHGPK